jgi:hypothetical protein
MGRRSNMTERRDEGAGKQADRMEERADQMDERSEEVEDQVESARREWDSRKQDPDIPGAQTEDGTNDESSETGDEGETTEGLGH